MKTIPKNNFIKCIAITLFLSTLHATIHCINAPRVLDKLPKKTVNCDPCSISGIANPKKNLLK